jgi:hypothetical protein
MTRRRTRAVHLLFRAAGELARPPWIIQTANKFAGYTANQGRHVQGQVSVRCWNPRDSRIGRLVGRASTTR